MKDQRYIEINDNENMAYQNSGDAAKMTLRGKFIALQVYHKKQEKSQINTLTLYLKKLKKRQMKPKVNRRKETIKIRVEINEIKNRNTIAKLLKQQSRLSENITKIDKLLARLIKDRKDKTLTNKIRNEEENLQQISEKYEGLYKNTVKDYLTPNLII